MSLGIMQGRALLSLFMSRILFKNICSTDSAHQHGAWLLLPYIHVIGRLLLDPRPHNATFGDVQTYHGFNCGSHISSCWSVPRLHQLDDLEKMIKKAKGLPQNSILDTLKSKVRQYAGFLLAESKYSDFSAAHACFRMTTHCLLPPPQSHARRGFF